MDVEGDGNKGDGAGGEEGGSREGVVVGGATSGMLAVVMLVALGAEVEVVAWALGLTASCRDLATRHDSTVQVGCAVLWVVQNHKYCIWHRQFEHSICAGR